MSFTLFKLFINTARQNLPRLTSVKPGNIRFVSAMEVVTENKEDEILRNKNYTRFKKRHREWQDSKKEDGESETKKPYERIKRKKMAMLLGYCGVDYYGMQRNPGVRTIEEDLLKAMLEAKYITEEDFTTQQNTQFQRSSRTDKGVSAARQVVSLKLPLEANKEEINSRLPKCIRVFGIKRVTNKFNSKVKCNARTYSYTLPTYVFEPSINSEEERKKYRITPEKLQHVNKVLEFYKGTKSYHNFTEKKHYQDPSSSRFMMGFSVDKVFVESDMEFAVLLVKGQSFMLHQIRKMVGLTIAIVRGHTDMTMMDKVFAKDKVITPTAPGLGLVLDMVHYDRYSAKHKTTHDALTWDDVEPEVDMFKHEHIYPVIVKGEIEGNSMLEWLDKLAQHSFDPADNVEKKDDEMILGDDDDDDDNGANDDKDEENDEKDSVNISNELKDVGNELKAKKTELKEDNTKLKEDNIEEVKVIDNNAEVVSNKNEINDNVSVLDEKDTVNQKNTL